MTVLLSTGSALALRNISCRPAQQLLNSNHGDQKLSPWKVATAPDICRDSNEQSVSTSFVFGMLPWINTELY